MWTETKQCTYVSFCFFFIVVSSSIQPASVLKSREKAKENKYKDACASRRETFCPFITSTDGLLAAKATTVLQRLAGFNAEKTERPYSVVMQFCRQRFAIALVKAVHLCLRTPRKLPKINANNLSQSGPPADPSTAYLLLHG